ncbi:hypothetical protein E2562_030744 [Oryza meyeriana var. granulata]|uniref:Uncharacterized protein n=1 Tax=Oryza meyeriana var. granulata TaxID=110450 RepID=A0A6G1E4C5_9ORYZ|nr:hypothetical protein E2562_030744 [Oryza meyeriana var. granulata]
MRKDSGRVAARREADRSRGDSASTVHALGWKRGLGLRLGGDRARSENVEHRTAVFLDWRGLRGLKFGPKPFKEWSPEGERRNPGVDFIGEGREGLQLLFND